MGGKGSGRKGGVPYEQNPIRQAADPGNVDRESNHRVIEFGKALWRFENPDLTDADSIEDAFLRYLELCDEHGVRPMVQSCAMALGVDRNVFHGIACDVPKYDNWRGGLVTPAGRCAFKKAYTFLAQSLEAFLLDEKGNPVKWIFLGKNYFGLRDQHEQVQVRVDTTRELPSPEEVRARYAGMLGRDEPPTEATEVEVEDVEDDTE